MTNLRQSIALMLVASLCQAVTVAQESAIPDPSQLQFSKFSGKINVPDPVAITIAPDGTAYVTQTQRRKAQDLDIRNNLDWVPNDVGLQSVAQKRAFYHDRLAPGKDQSRNRDRVADLNGDGSHDWHDLTVISEKIHWLRDEDGDGTADATGLFADGFQTEVTGIAAGVLWHQGDVYATVAPDVWKLRDTNGDRKTDVREVMATGFGLHIAYGGHDMHGLTVGPDGKIYWSIGDKGISATSREGRRFHYPNQGGVMRCDPDGSNFEVFAHGLRNVQELAFDAYGNLFSVDNDADFPDEKERFVYIVRDMDAGWRCNYQYRGDGYNPWMEERLWQPHFDGQASYILPAITNYVDGPAGFAFNPGTALSSAYRDYFFLTGAPDGYQYAFTTKPRGASFEMHGEHQIGSGIPIVGINFGPDGALYGVDWGGGYPLNQTGAVWRIDVEASDLKKQRLEVAQQLREGFANRSSQQLASMLAHPDQRLRLGAQFELVNRGKRDLLAAALSAPEPLARVHAIWGLGQLAREGDSPATSALLSTLDSKDGELRAQSARTLADVPELGGAAFVPLLSDPSDRVRFMAAMALSRHPTEEAAETLLSWSDSLEESQRYLRLAASRAIAACLPTSEIETARIKSSRVGRLNLVVAFRNAGAEVLNPFLVDSDEGVATEAARALHDDFSDRDRLRGLADSLSRTQHDGEAFLRRALNANYRRGGQQELDRIADFAWKTTHEESLRVEALEMLGTWKTPDLLDRVDGRRRDLSGPRDANFEGLTERLSHLALNGKPNVASAALQASRGLDLTLSAAALRKLVSSDSVDSAVRIAALQGLQNQNSANFPEALATALSANERSLRMVAVEFFVDENPTAAEQHLLALFRSSTSRQERQHAIDQLSRLPSESAKRFLLGLLSKLKDGTLPGEIAVETVEAASRPDADPRLAAALAAAMKAVSARSNTLPQSVREFAICRDGGDVAVGKQIFQTHLSAQCVRCHKIGGQGSDVGPSLKGIAKKRDRDYLLRSVVAPSAEIDEKYRSQTLLLFSGQVVQGLIQKETDDEVELVDAQGKTILIPADEIEAVNRNSLSIMPDMTKDLTFRQVRDLVAFLASLK